MPRHQLQKKYLPFVIQAFNKIMIRLSYHFDMGLSLMSLVDINGDNYNECLARFKLFPINKEIIELADYYKELFDEYFTFLKVIYTDMNEADYQLLISMILHGDVDFLNLEHRKQYRSIKITIDEDIECVNSMKTIYKEVCEKENIPEGLFKPTFLWLGYSSYQYDAFRTTMRGGTVGSKNYELFLELEAREFDRIFGETKSDRFKSYHTFMTIVDAAMGRYHMTIAEAAGHKAKYC